MADAISFTLKLVDRVTKPAKAITEALKALKPVLDSVGDKTLMVQMPEVKLKAGGVPKAPPAPKLPKPDLPKSPSETIVGPLAPLKLARGELEKLKQQLRDDKLAVTNLSASLRQLKDAAVPNLPAIKAVNEQLAAAKNRLADVQVKLARSGNSARFGSEGTNRLTTTLRELAEAAGARGITDFGAKLRGIAEPLSKATGLSVGATAAIAALGVAAVAAVAGIAALTVAIGALIKKGAGLALSAVQARENTEMMFQALLGSADAGKAVAQDIRDITRDTTATYEQASQLAKSLTEGGIRSTRQLVSATRSIATIDTVIQGAGSKVEGFIKRAALTKVQSQHLYGHGKGVFTLNPQELLGTGIKMADMYEELAKRSGKSISDIRLMMRLGRVGADAGISALNAVIQKKFGEMALTKAQRFDRLMLRLKENFGRLFDGIKTARFEAALGKVVDLFDDMTISGEALKEMITVSFDGVFKVLEHGLAYAKVAMKGLIIIGLQIAIGMKPVIARLREAFGGDAAKGPLTLAKTMSLVGQAARIVVGAFAAVVAFKPMWDALAATIASIGKIIVGFMQGGFTGALAGVGAAVVNGIVAGITSTGGLLYEAATNLAKTTLARFKSAFQIHSPSRVMMGMGVNLSLGLAEGIQSAAPVASDSLQNAVAPPRLNPSLAARGSSSGAASQVTFEAGAFQINGVPNAESLTVTLPQVLINIFEQMAATQGRNPAPTT